MRATRLHHPRRFAGCQALGMIELVCAVAVIAVLLMLATRWMAPKRDYGSKACQRNLQNIYIALELYARDNGGKFPVITNAQTSAQPLALLIPRYTTDTASFICPVSDDPPPAPGTQETMRTSYAYYMGRTPVERIQPLMSDRQVDSRPKKPGDPVFSLTGKPPGSNHPEGGNVLFCDGRVESTASKSRFSLDVQPGVALLNPEP